MNQYLKDKQYKIPLNVLKGIEIAKASTTSANGLKRANFILKNGYLTYQAMKRILHDFSTMDSNQFALAGGQPMKSFIETTLNQDRNAISTSKEVRQDIPKNYSNQDMMPHQASPRLNEVEKKEKNKNAVAVIINDDNKILLLKRSETAPWMPKKWSLVGGNIDKGERPQQTVEREIEEETGLKIKNFIKSFTIERHANSIEHVFACRYNGELTDIKLDNENTNYGWYDVNEIDYLDTVPHLIEFITLVFKKYD